MLMMSRSYAEAHVGRGLIGTKSTTLPSVRSRCVNANSSLNTVLKDFFRVVLEPRGWVPTYNEGHLRERIAKYLVLVL